MTFRSSNVSLLGFGLVLVLGWICYSNAFSGPLQLDDVVNLGGLASIDDADSTINFIFAGEAGPLGRPIALASFAVQAKQWPDEIAAFYQVNVLIHLLNAMLLAWVLYQLGRASSVDRDKAVAVACAAAGIWVIMPLLATASLLVVQRMTTLAAFFTLLGLGGYLVARRRLESTPVSAMFGLSASLVLATTFGAFAKESAVLLPLYILVIEATLLPRPGGIKTRHWRVWQAVFLVLPTGLVVAYLLSRIPYPDTLSASRDFNAWERLLTESKILWLYIKNALLGLPGNLGIYRTGPAIVRGLFEPLTFLAVVGWAGIATAAIFWRRRYPLFAFAVLWFLTGHLIESTVIPLELYFEHRNYLPIIGPVFAICAASLFGARPVARIANVAIPAYILLSAWFLWMFSALWGDPGSSSRYWAERYPDSVRAVTNHATFQLASEGPGQTIATLEKFSKAHPEHAYVAIQQLNLACLIDPGQQKDELVSSLIKTLPRVNFTYTSATMLSQLLVTVSRVECSGVNLNTVESLANALHRNPLYANDPRQNHFHHKLRANIAAERGDHELRIHHLEEAFASYSSPELILMMVVSLVNNGDTVAANDFIDRAAAKLPRNPMKAAIWRRNLDSLREFVEDAHQQMNTDQSGS